MSDDLLDACSRAVTGAAASVAPAVVHIELPSGAGSGFVFAPERAPSWVTTDGGGRFTEVVLHPAVTIVQGDAALAATLHEQRTRAVLRRQLLLRAGPP